MSVSLASPPSPRTCNRIARTLLELRVPSNTMWVLDRHCPLGEPRMAVEFDEVEDLLGVDAYGALAVALVIDCRVDGADTAVCYVQSACGCAGVAGRDPWGAIEVFPSTGGLEGWLHDIGRRLLGLATAPEPAHPIDLLSARWLTRLLDTVADPATRWEVRGWDDAVALHPLAEAAGLLDDDGHAVDPDEMVRRVWAIAGSWNWELVHLEAIAHAPSADVCGDVVLSSEVLAWMDAPMFARWALGNYREPAELADECSLFVTPGLVDRVLCAVGIPRR